MEICIFGYKFICQDRNGRFHELRVRLQWSVCPRPADYLNRKFDQMPDIACDQANRSLVVSLKMMTKTHII